jgi:glycolate oxidase iron-sulfur subunit
MRNGRKSDEVSCAKCGTCNTVCPVYLVTGNEIHTPRGKQHLQSKLERGEMSAHYAEIFSQCLLCGACREICPRNLDTPELVMRVRAELPRFSGYSFLSYLSRKALVHPLLLSGLTRIGGVANTLLGSWLPQESGMHLRLQGFDREALPLPEKGYLEKVKAEMASGVWHLQTGQEEVQIGFFTGCFANHLQPEIAEATQSLLQKSCGGKAVVPLAQTCCGMAALAAGRADEARALARRNIMAFEANDFPILTSCSSCYFQLKSYPELFADNPEWRDRAGSFADRLREFSTFFLETFTAAGSNLFKVKAPTPAKVFYHDPCHLRFKLHITKEPRQLLQLLPGVEFQDLPEGPKCCGHGGLFHLAHPDLALKIQTELMADFETLKVQTVLTACSGCLLQWQSRMMADTHQRKAEHLAVFIARLLQ